MPMSDDRLRLWLNFWKIVISSVVVTGGVTLATTMINANLQEKEVAIKEVEKQAEISSKIIDQEKSYLSSFLENALDENTERKYQFALFFKSLTYSEQFASGWDEYFKAVQLERELIQHEKSSIQAQLPNKTGEELEKAEMRIAQLEKELSRSSESPLRFFSPPVSVREINDSLGCSPEQRLMVKGIASEQEVGGLRLFFISIPRIMPIYVSAYCESQDGSIGDVTVFDRIETAKDLTPSTDTVE